MTFHIDDMPKLDATWLFDNGNEVTIALVLAGMMTIGSFKTLRGMEGAAGNLIPRARFARAV